MSGIPDNFAELTAGLDEQAVMRIARAFRLDDSAGWRELKFTREATANAAVLGERGKQRAVRDAERTAERLKQLQQS